MVARSPMLRRDQHTTSPSGSARSHPVAPPRGVGSVLALQRSLGNRDTARLLARKGGSTRGTFENSVQIGKLGPIEIKDGNVGDWIGKKQPDDLVLTTTMGKHSGELKQIGRASCRERV